MITEAITYKKLQGFFKGIVLQHLSQGRCKVFIPGVYAETWQTTPDLIPPAEQIAPLFGGSANGNGVFSYPSIGSVVVCGFWNGDSNLPYFFGTVLGGKEAFNSYAVYSRTNPTEETIKNGSDVCSHSFKIKNTTLKFDEAGNVEIVAGDGRDENLAKITLDGMSGCISLDATTQIQFNAPNIKFTVDGNFEIDANGTTNLKIDPVNITMNTSNLEANSLMHVYVESPAIKLNARTEHSPSGTIFAQGKKNGKMIAN